MSVNSYEALMQSAAGTTVSMVSWARSSAWKGEALLPDDQNRTLQEMFTHPGAQRTEDELIRCRSALQNFLREQYRRLNRPGRASAGPPATDVSARVLDQGLAETWTFDNVDDFIDRTGLEAVVPGLKSVSAPVEYRREAYAAAGLTAKLAKAWGWEAAEVQTELLRRRPEQRLLYFTQPKFDAADLEFLVPPAGQAAARARIEGALAGPLGQLDGVTGDGDEFTRSCAATGVQAVTAAWAEIDKLAQENANPQLMDFLQNKAPAAAQQLIGAGQIAFNGKLSETTTMGGIAGWNGTISLHNEYVVQPLVEMLAEPGKQHDEETLKRFRLAAGILLHEYTHFALPDVNEGATAQEQYALSAQPFGTRRWVQFGEEGMVEAFNTRNLPEFIRLTGLDKIAPGIENVQTYETYERFAPAGREVTGSIDELTGQDGEAIRRQAAASPRGQFPELADQMFEAGGLEAIVPEPERDVVKRDIEHAMRTNFAWLDENTGGGNLDQVRAMSALRGRQAFLAGHHVVETAKKLYSSPTAEALYQYRLATQRGRNPQTTTDYAEPGPVREGQWEQATDALYADSRLPEVVPEPETFHAKRAIATAMATATDPHAAGRATVATLEQQYTSPDSKALFQALQAAHSGVAAPGSRPQPAPEQSAAAQRDFHTSHQAAAAARLSTNRPTQQR